MRLRVPRQVARCLRSRPRAWPARSSRCRPSASPASIATSRTRSHPHRPRARRGARHRAGRLSQPGRGERARAARLRPAGRGPGAAAGLAAAKRATHAGRHDPRGRRTGRARCARGAPARFRRRRRQREDGSGSRNRHAPARRPRHRARPAIAVAAEAAGRGLGAASLPDERRAPSSWSTPTSRRRGGPRSCRAAAARSPLASANKRSRATTAPKPLRMAHDAHSYPNEAFPYREHRTRGPRRGAAV